MRHRYSIFTKTVYTVLAGMFLAVTAVGGPLWTHRPASDIKWYKTTDIRSVLVSESNGQDGTRNDLANVEVYQIDQVVKRP